MVAWALNGALSYCLGLVTVFIPSFFSAFGVATVSQPLPRRLASVIETPTFISEI